MMLPGGLRKPNLHTIMFIDRPMIFNTQALDFMFCNTLCTCMMKDIPLGNRLPDTIFRMFSMSKADKMWAKSKFSYTLNVFTRENNVESLPFCNLDDEALFKLLWVFNYPYTTRYKCIYHKLRLIPRSLRNRYRFMLLMNHDAPSHLKWWLTPFHERYQYCYQNLFLMSLTKLLEHGILSFSIQRGDHFDYYKFSTLISEKHIVCLCINMYHPRLSLIYRELKKIPTLESLPEDPFSIKLPPCYSPYYHCYM